MCGEKNVKKLTRFPVQSGAKIFEYVNHLYSFILIYTSVVNQPKSFTFLSYITVSFYPIFCNGFLAQVLEFVKRKYFVICIF